MQQIKENTAILAKKFVYMFILDEIITADIIKQPKMNTKKCLKLERLLSHLIGIAALMKPEGTDKLNLERENNAVRNGRRSSGASSP